MGGVFVSTLSQTAFLFSLIIVGYILAKFKFIPESSASVISKLENLLFVPALVTGTFITNFTVEKLTTAWRIMLVSFIIIFVSMPLSFLAARLLGKNKYQRNIYTYGLIFSNFGFMGNSVVAALFPEIFLDYIIFTMPLWFMIYLWGTPTLLIADAEGKQTFAKRLKAFLNPMFIGMIIGMIIGISGITLPSWITNVITSAGNCMSPLAMLLIGITVSSISLKKAFTNVRIYAASVLRLIVFPAIFLVVAHFVPMDKTIFLCAACATAMPLGLSTVVIPAAYGRDTTDAASMCIISHVLSCITIPIIFWIIL